MSGVWDIVRGRSVIAATPFDRPRSYREVPPAGDLSGFVACGWTRVVRQQATAPSMPIVPDGCADIILCDDRAPVLVGPDTVARFPQLAGGAVIVGLRFRPGALRSILGFSTEQLVDRSIPLEQLSADSRTLHHRLVDAGTPDQRLNLLEQWVRAKVNLAMSDLGVIHACRRLAKPSSDLAEIAHQMGWSTRKLRREFLATCGYGPKTMQRILRVQQASRLAHRSPAPLRLSELALRSGFSDQAHMTREFRAITGSTPTTFLARSEPGLSQWLDSDWPE